MLKSLALTGALALANPDPPIAVDPSLVPGWALAADMELVALVSPTSFRAVNPSDHALMLVLHTDPPRRAAVQMLAPRSGMECRFPLGALDGLWLRVAARTERGLELSTALELGSLARTGLVGFDLAIEEPAEWLAELAWVPLHAVTSSEGAKALNGAVLPLAPAPTHSPAVTPQGKKKDVPPVLEEQLPPL